MSDKYTMAITHNSWMTMEVNLDWLLDLHQLLGCTTEHQFPGSYEIWKALDSALEEAHIRTRLYPDPEDV